MDEEREQLDKLVDDVQAIAEPVPIVPASLTNTENGSGVLRIPFATSTVVRDEYGRISALTGPGGTKTLIRNDKGAITGVYEEREEIIPE